MIAQQPPIKDATLYDSPMRPATPQLDAALPGSSQPLSRTAGSQAKRKAASLSVLAAALITLLKLVTGLATGSLGMLSESAHSGIDLIAAAITLFSVRAADRPADDEHNYGHGKIESLAAFLETGLMLASSLWIVYEAVHRILFRNHLSLPLNAAPFVVLFLSIAVDFSRSRSLRRVAQDTHSEALAADAIHFSTDIYASAAVILGLTATALGERYHLPALELADPIAALVVSAIILRVSWSLARHTLDTLLDATPAQHGQTAAATRRKLIHDLEEIDGVLDVARLRTRRSGSGYFADLTLAMPRNLTFQRSEQITVAATEAVQRVLPSADVVVHSVPTATLAESVHDRVRAVAARANLSIHDVSLQQYDNALHLELHLEVDETLTLQAAHEIVTRLEANIRAEIPGIASILTHIESEPATIERPAALARNRLLEHALRNVACLFPEILDIHDIQVTRHNDRTQVNCHCTLPDELPMSRVHEVITALENSFKLEAPEVSRLLIHPEPATDNRR
jgi:cation diffusion facilitator family transporter